MSTATPPRYSAPDRSRQRVRLVAAIGLLASTAIAVGGLVHLLPSRETPPAEPTREPTATPTALRGELHPHDSNAGSRDSLEDVILEVERAERAVSSARAALRRARMLGVDDEQLDWLERRLDALGGLPMPPSREPASSRGGAREL
ncbi:hypothetical protein ACNOYE_19635 [Nannocystaceae bacterium ST9]